MPRDAPVTSAVALTPRYKARSDPAVPRTLPWRLADAASGDADRVEPGEE
jgi:hypothetical protein